jgi:beta-N-acetylhexosaminidase
MTLDRLALGVLLPGFRGTSPPDWVRRAVDDGLGGVVLFGDNIPLAGGLDGVVVAIDEEGGDVTRLGTPSPGNLALGHIDDVELTERVAGAIARDAAAAGATMNFAPVADVNADVDNAAIGVRSFGADAELVARHTAAYVRGTQRAGVAACAKHFPGHGHTTEDSHRELPTLTIALDEPLLPFRAAIEAGVAAIMTAHIRVPALDDVPATLSSVVLQELLRGELGFSGLIVTDALEMGAISNAYGLEEAAVRALAAGADALCLGYYPGDREVRSIAASVVDAVGRGELSEERLAEASDRVSRATATFRPRTTVTRGNGALGREAAQHALHVEGNARLAGAPFVIELHPEPLVAAGESSFGFGDALRQRAEVAGVVRAEWGDSVLEPPEVPLVLVVRDAHRHPWQRAAAEELLARRPDAVVVETGLPVWRPPRAAGYVVTYGGGRVNLEAAAAAVAPVRERVAAKEA